MKSLASAKVLLVTKDRLRGLKVEDRARWGRMTATEMVRHLSQSCEVALGDRKVGVVKGPPQALIKWVALRSGLPWKKNFRTTPELELALKEESSATFDELVEEAVAKTEALVNGERWTSSHPMFGAMTAEDWMRWGYLHADHHLRQFGR
jgi:hypothetical protein